MPWTTNVQSGAGAVTAPGVALCPSAAGHPGLDEKECTRHEKGRHPPEDAKLVHASVLLALGYRLSAISYWLLANYAITLFRAVGLATSS